MLWICEISRITSIMSYSNLAKMSMFTAPTNNWSNCTLLCVKKAGILGNTWQANFPPWENSIAHIKMDPKLLERLNWEVLPQISYPTYYCTHLIQEVKYPEVRELVIYIIYLFLANFSTICFSVVVFHCTITLRRILYTAIIFQQVLLLWQI